MTVDPKHSDLARLCLTAYSDDAAPNEGMVAPHVKAHVTAVHVLTFEDVRVLVVSTLTTNFVVVRGTVFESKASASRNIRTTAVDDGSMAVHGGYYAACNELSGPLAKLLQRHPDRQNTKDVVLCGHSAGGAMAAVFAAKLSKAAERNELAPVVKRLATFGAPRVGDYRFGNWIHRLSREGCDIARYTSTSDPVPRLPPFWRDLGHWTPELYLDCSDGVIFEPWAIRRWIDGLAVRSQSGALQWAKAHAIATYIEKLERRGL